MKGLDAAFGTFFDTRKPRGARQVNDMQIKLAKFRVAFTWECHQTEDELFPVHNGRLLIPLRDRERIIEASEFTVVLLYVEHCPVALTDARQVKPLEPASTTNAGTEVEPRTVTRLNPD